MNLKLNFGKTKAGKDVIFDLQKDHIHTIFLTGSTGSGKSVLHYSLYKQLLEQNPPRKLILIPMDMTRVDFAGWQSDYYIRGKFVDPKDSLDYLDKILENPPVDYTIVIHIEECDMMVFDPGRFEASWQKIQKTKNIYAVFSTSRPAKDIFTKTIKEHTDMIVSCLLTSKQDSETVLGSPGAEKLSYPGEKIISTNGKQIHVEPFNENEIKEIQRFEKYMRKDPELMKLYESIVRQHASVIEQTLKAYGITVLVDEIGYLPNESIEYRIKITEGTKITDILKRKKELALALASPTGTIEIKAPIPGRSLIGITVPKIPLLENTKKESRGPKTIAGKVLNKLGEVLGITAFILLHSSERIEENKNIGRQILIVVIVPVVLTILFFGFDLHKMFEYFLVSLVVWILILGSQQKDENKVPEKKKENLK